MSVKCEERARRHARTHTSEVKENSVLIPRHYLCYMLRRALSSVVAFRSVWSTTFIAKIRAVRGPVPSPVASSPQLIHRTFVVIRVGDHLSRWRSGSVALGHGW